MSGAGTRTFPLPVWPYAKMQTCTHHMLLGNLVSEVIASPCISAHMQQMPHLVAIQRRLDQEGDLLEHLGLRRQACHAQSFLGSQNIRACVHAWQGAVGYRQHASTPEPTWVAAGPKTWSKEKAVWLPLGKETSKPRSMESPAGQTTHPTMRASAQQPSAHSIFADADIQGHLPAPEAGNASTGRPSSSRSTSAPLPPAGLTRQNTRMLPFSVCMAANSHAQSHAMAAALPVSYLQEVYPSLWELLSNGLTQEVVKGTGFRRGTC